MLSHRTRSRISPRRRQQPIRRPKKNIRRPAQHRLNHQIRMPIAIQIRRHHRPRRSPASSPPAAPACRCYRSSASSAKDSPHPPPAHPDTPYRATARPSHSGTSGAFVPTIANVPSSCAGRKRPIAVPMRQINPALAQPHPRPTPDRHAHHDRSPPPQSPHPPLQSSAPDVNVPSPLFSRTCVVEAVAVAP